MLYLHFRHSKATMLRIRIGAPNNETEDGSAKARIKPESHSFPRKVQWPLLPPCGDDAASCRWFLLAAKAALKSFFSCQIKIN